MKLKVVKKNGLYTEDFDFKKIEKAVKNAAERAGKEINEDELVFMRYDIFNSKLKGKNVISIQEIHTIVEGLLRNIDEDIYVEYCKYQDYKKKFPFAFNEMLQETKRVTFGGDKENANKNSAINSTQKEIMSGLVSEQIMLNYEYKPYISRAHKEGWIYIHDLRDRAVYNFNCCLFDALNVMKGGFRLNGVDIPEPDTFEDCIDLLNDITMCASSQQYGGFTLPEIDKTIGYFLTKTHLKEMEYQGLTVEEFEERVYHKLKKRLRKLEHKINCVNNALGQTPFVTWTFGLGTDPYQRMVSKAILEVRMEKLGTNKITAIFPKLVFLHRNDLNGTAAAPNYDIKKLAIKCSAKNLYPDFLSLDNGYLGEVYDRCGEPISPMGCRAFLSPYYNEEGKEIYMGRFNIGAITLILPKMAIESKGDLNEFYRLIDEHMEMAAKVHEYTYRRMSQKKASSNPLFFCEGGAWTKLNYDDTIEKALEAATASFGYIGLEEAVYCLTGKHLDENIDLAKAILQRMKDNTEFYKEKYNRLFALYSTPSEGLCDKALKKDLKTYGLIEGVTDKEWYTNSFHVGVERKVTALEKMALENELFHIPTGGRIVYTEWYQTDNYEAIEAVANKAMEYGLYFGINIEASTCKDCGKTDFEGKVCPSCKSTRVITVSRVCGYLGISDDEGESRFNDGKKAERDNRVKHYCCLDYYLKRN